tara:strand:- start:60 stop:791 length:732 start_codon:yes stop_codon:yes gene_type:complete
MEIVRFNEFCKILNTDYNRLNSGLYGFNFALKSFNHSPYECGCGKTHYLNEHHTEMRWHGKPLPIVGNIEEMIIQDRETDCSFINYVKNRGFYFYKYKTIYSARIPKSYTDSDFGKTDSISKDEIKKKYKDIAKFYNNYNFYEYYKKGRKKPIISPEIQKQFKGIIKLDRDLENLSDSLSNETYRVLLVGIITYKFMSVKQMHKVHKDMTKIYDIGKVLKFEKKLMIALENLLDDNLGDFENF